MIVVVMQYLNLHFDFLFPFLPWLKADFVGETKSTMFSNNLVNYVIYLKSDVILGKYTVLYLISYHLWVHFCNPLDHTPKNILWCLTTTWYLFLLQEPKRKQHTIFDWSAAMFLTCASTRQGLEGKKPLNNHDSLLLVFAIKTRILTFICNNRKTEGK